MAREILTPIFDKDDLVSSETVEIRKDVVDSLLRECFSPQGRISMPCAKGFKATRDELREAIERKKKGEGNVEVLKEPEEVEFILDNYQHHYIDLISDFIESKDWEGLKNLIGELLETPKLADSLPSDIKDFVEHDTEVFENGIVNFAGEISGECENGVVDLEMVKIKYNALINAWKMYQYCIRDIILRWDGNKDRIPQSSFRENVEVQDVYENVKNYFEQSMSGAKCDIEFENNITGTALCKVNLNTIGNLTQNIINNAHHYATDNVKISLDKMQDGDEEYVVISVLNNGVKISEEINEEGDRKGRHKIFNQGYSQRKSSGLGTAYAEERLESMGCKVEIKNNVDVDGKEYNGFEIIIPITK